MGLDSFWMYGDEPLYLDFDPELNLIGGMFSGSGAGSFRGKSYSDFIENISGVSLYQEDMPNEDVVRIAEALENTSMETKVSLLKEDWGGMEDNYEQHITDVTRMFRSYADYGATLHGWW